MVTGGDPDENRGDGSFLSHSERIHVLGDENLQRIGIARDQSQQLLELGSQLNTAVQAFRV